MPGQVLMFPWRNTGLAYHRDERMPQGVEVRVAALGVAIGEEVALLRFRSLAGIRERLQPFLAGFLQVVLYLALVAFLGEYCRILIRVRDVYYTGNVAMALPRTPLKDS